LSYEGNNPIIPQTLSGFQLVTHAIHGHDHIPVGVNGGEFLAQQVHQILDALAGVLVILIPHRF